MSGTVTLFELYAVRIGEFSAEFVCASASDPNAVPTLVQFSFCAAHASHPTTLV